jgi:hypothetical protein
MELAMGWWRFGLLFGCSSVGGQCHSICFAYLAVQPCLHFAVGCCVSGMRVSITMQPNHTTAFGIGQPHDLPVLYNLRLAFEESNSESTERFASQSSQTKQKTKKQKKPNQTKPNQTKPNQTKPT